MALVLGGIAAEAVTVTPAMTILYRYWSLSRTYCD